MADARRQPPSHPQVRSDTPPPWRHHTARAQARREPSPPRRGSAEATPRHHVPRMGAPVDKDGFTLVQSRRRWRRYAVVWPHRPRAVPPEFVGKCFNCLAYDHVHMQCTFPSKCYHCHSMRYRAWNCKRHRLPSGKAAPRAREPPHRRLRRPDGYASTSSTVSSHSCSTGRDTSVPPMCGAHSPGWSSPHQSPHLSARDVSPRRPPPSPRGSSPARYPPPSPPPPPPPGNASRRPHLELLLFRRNAELNEAEAALSSLALVALVGGNRVSVSSAQVRD